MKGEQKGVSYITFNDSVLLKPFNVKFRGSAPDHAEYSAYRRNKATVFFEKAIEWVEKVDKRNVAWRWKGETVRLLGLSHHPYYQSTYKVGNPENVSLVLQEVCISVGDVEEVAVLYYEGGVGDTRI